MKRKILAAVVAALTIAGFAAPASAQRYDRNGYVDTYHGEAYREWGGNEHRRWRHAEITVRKDGRSFSFDRDDHLFYRLIDHPFGFRPGLTYEYTDRCNRHGCVVFVFSRHSRWPVDRIFAPHLRLSHWAWRDYDGFDRDYRAYGHYSRSDRWLDEQWRYDDRQRWRDGDERWGEFEHELLR